MSNRCQICSRTDAETELMAAGTIRPALSAFILGKYPQWSSAGFICRNDFKALRLEQMIHSMEKEKGDLTDLEKEVIIKLSEHESMASDVDREFYSESSWSEKLSDRMTAFGGSWTYILMFFGVTVLWMLINSFLLLSRPFDPYPYIFLNLVLSCMAAIQAPVIMMSQNRQDARDRKRSQYDYKINLKAELEIRQLTQKIDFLISKQMERLSQIQELQMELMEEVRHAKRP